MARKKGNRTRGTGSVYQRPNGVWAIQWIDSGKRRTATGFANRDEAQRVLMVKVAEVVQAPKRNIALAGDRTVDDLAQVWLEARKGTKKSYTDDLSRYNKHVKPVLGGEKAGEVTPEMVEALITQKLGEGLSPQTVQHITKTITGIFKKAKLPSPVREIASEYRSEMAPNPKSRPFIQNKEDVARLFQAMPEGDFRVLYAVGAWAGLRRGEALALRIEDCDFRNGFLKVERQATDDHRIDVVKNGKAKGRTIPLAEPLRSVLKAHVDKLGRSTGPLFVPEVGDRLRCLTEEGEEVWVYSPHALLNTIHAALASCGLPPHLDWYGATRHTFGAQFALAGGNLYHLSRILGHSSITVTEKHYAHLHPQSAVVPAAMFAFAVAAPTFADDVQPVSGEAPKSA